jgi:hypothetical protein
MRLHLHRIGGAHERIMRRRDRADHSFGREFAQPVEREDDVPLLLEAGAIEID